MTHDHDHHHHGGCCGSHDQTRDRPAHSPAEGAADLSGPAEAPVAVEVTRGGMVESRHRAHAVIVDAGGRVLAQWGDIGKPVYARSAIKSLQAIPLIETGAFDAFGLGEEELALACASHNGEPAHTELAARWLARIGCTVEDYECGVHLPYDEPTAHALLRRGETPTALHNNCSGKHAGFLTTARHKGEPTRGYVRWEHPVQQRILGVLEQMTGQDLSHAPWGVDGCAIPTIGIPLGAIAYAMARIADPQDLPDRRAEAVTRIRTAWVRHPYLVGGRDTFDTAVMRAAQGAALTKVGAEGVGVAVLPGQGVGIAVKVEDGADRARDVAMAALLRAADALTDAQWAGVPTLLATPLTNRNGTAVGEIRPTEGWPRP